MSRIGHEELNRLHRLVGDNPAEALRELSKALAACPDDLTLRFNSGGMLIDIGVGLARRDYVERGIHILERFHAAARGQHDVTLLYNLANGYSALHELDRRGAGFVFDPDTTPLLSAKRYYRDALALSDGATAHLRSMLRVNYANCLAQFGRCVEAIDLYDLALADLPDHAMALGNLGMELNRYAYIAGDLALLKDAREALRSALQGDRLEHTGLSNARPRFEKTLREVEERLAGMRSGAGHAQDRAPGVTTKHAEQYVQFCLEHHLVLNFSLRNRGSAQATEDTVSLRLLTAIDDETTYYRLSRIVNEVKERFAVARLLMYEACCPPIRTEEYDSLTVYADNLDYSVYGISAGKLKVAFEAAYNVLDKIAFFLNEYLHLGIPERGVTFATVWKRPNQPLRAEIQGLDNWHLRGLYDISRDLASGEYLGEMGLRRNFSTHRYLVPHTERFGWREEADNMAYHITYDELLREAIALMKLVRNAVIYWIAAVDQEERKKHKGAKGLTLPMIMPRLLHYPFGPDGS